MLGILRKLALLFGVSTLAAASGPNVLSNSGHAAPNISIAITTVLGAGILDVTIFCDATDNDTSFLGAAALITASQDTGRSNFRCSDFSTPVNHAPYVLLTQSSTGYALSIETANYATLLADGLEFNWAFTAALANNTPPGILTSNISQPGGVTGGGVEFTMSASYKGLDTSTPSATAAGFAGLLLAVQYNHPTWKWPDIIGAYRQTAANWASGWNQMNYGYGVISYDNATAIASTASIYLEPPILMAVSAGPGMLTLTLYPYRQTRRDHEVVYIVPATYVWPVKNEYVLSDITASGGTLIYTSNGTDVIPNATVSFSVRPGLYHLVAFTTDNLGAYSRHEAFSDTSLLDQCL